MGWDRSPRSAERQPGRGGRQRASACQPRRAPANIIAAEEAPAVMFAGLLALQAEDSGEELDREARRHGHDLLAELAALQRALLADGADGGVPVDQLHRLATLAAAVPAAADPHLREVMEAITLRARVELARFGV